MKKLSNKDFLERMKDYPDYIPLEEYKGSNEKIRFLHKKCNSEILITPHDFFSGHGCRKCNFRGGVEKRTFESVKDEIESNEGYKLLSKEYLNNKSKLRILHEKCGNEFEMRFDQFHNGQRCPFCRRNKKKSKEEFENQIKEYFGEEYELVSEYKGSNSKVKIKHLPCGNTREVYAKRLLRGDRCPFCNHKSKGEDEIEKILKKLEIPFEREAKFEDCFLNERYLLPFDFKVEIDNEIFIIEFDGEQHFKPIFGGMKEFNLTVKRDFIKNQFVLSKGFRLLRIKYSTKFSEIESILKKFLYKQNLILSDKLFLISSSVQNEEVYYQETKKSLATYLISFIQRLKESKDSK